MDEHSASVEAQTPLSTQGKIPVFFGALSTVVLALILTLKNPTAGGPLLILVFLLVLFIWFLSLMWIGLQILADKVLKKRLSTLRHLYTSVALATGLIFLVGLQTLHQLRLADGVLVIIFEILLNFYLLRRF